MIQQASSKVDSNSIGGQLFDLAESLFPIHRSQTGEGNRLTFDILSKHIPLKVVETPSNQQVYGWTVPLEWKLQDAFISYQGKRIIDYQNSNLHVLNGSESFSGELRYSELKKHLHSHEHLPEAIPYRTAFFRKQWGFCVTQSQLEILEELDGPFEVLIDSFKMDGFLTHAEIDTQPDAEQSFLIWAHCCHPSLANDNVSGLAVATFLARHLQSRKTRLNYRMVFAPATIGAINWLATSDLEPFMGGLVLSLLGDSNGFHYKQTPRGESLIDRVFQLMAESGSTPLSLLDFDPFGYDERQFCSPASSLHVGRITRSLPGQFPEYHSSLDNLDLISATNLEESYTVILQAIEILEHNELLFNTQGHCEPFLQPYDLYRAHGDNQEYSVNPEAVMYVLNQTDGHHDLIEISQTSGLPFFEIAAAAQKLKEVGILIPVDEAVQ